MENEFTQNDSTTTISLAKKHFSKLGLMFFIGTLLIYGIQYGASAIANMINPELMSDTASALLITMLPMYLIAIPLTALLLRTVPASHIASKKMSVGQWLIAFLICYGAMYLSNLLGTFLTQFIGVLKGSPVSNTMLEVATSSNLPVNFFIMVICAPIAEELIFRKMLVDRTAAYGEGTAVLFSGLMFGLFHGNLNQFAYAFTLGICFAFIYVKTGKIIYTILLHMAINFFGSILSVFMLQFVGPDFLEALNDPTLLMPYIMTNMSKVIVYFIYAFILLGISFAGIILFIVNAKKFRLLPGEITIPKGKRFSTTILNIGMGLFFLFWIAMIVIQLFA